MGTAHAIVIACPKCGARNRIAPERASDRPVCGRCREPLPGAGEIVALDDASFDRFVAGTSLPVLVDFWAPWCGPCRAFGPIVDEFARKAAGRAAVAKLNVDESPQTAARFRVQGIPMVVVMRDGREAAREVGLVPLAVLEKLVLG